MRRLLSLCLLLFVIPTTTTFAHSHQASVKVQKTICINIPAYPDYTNSGSNRDVIAAINNARRQEHLRDGELHLGSRLRGKRQVPAISLAVKGPARRTSCRSVVCNEGWALSEIL